MHFLIDIEFTKTLNQFFKKIFVDLFMIFNFKFLKNILNLIFVNYNNFLNKLLIRIFLYFDYKS
jgi:hypothetical protein